MATAMGGREDHRSVTLIPRRNAAAFTVATSAPRSGARMRAGRGPCPYVRIQGGEVRYASGVSLDPPVPPGHLVASYDTQATAVAVFLESPRYRAPSAQSGEIATP